MSVSVKVSGELPGLKALIQRMNDANRRVLVGVPAGEMAEGDHARTEQAAKKLSTRALKRAARNLRDGREVSQSLADTIATGGKGEAIPLAMIAAVHEFGYPEGNIPERSFIRGGIRRGIPKFNKVNEDSLRKVVRGEMTCAGALEKLGVIAVGEVKREFVTADFVPNKPETIRRKGSSRPLVDTGQLRQSITYVLDGQQSAGAKVIE